MVFLVVQWEGENSVSVVSETKLVQKNDVDMELTEGMNVEVLAGKNAKGRSAIYQATVLKVFGEYVWRINSFRVSRCSNALLNFLIKATVGDYKKWRYYTQSL